MCSLRTGMDSLRRGDKRRDRSSYARYCTSVAAAATRRALVNRDHGTNVRFARERTGNCDRDRELKLCYRISVGVGGDCTNLAIAGSTANVGVRLASLYWA